MILLLIILALGLTGVAVADTYNLNFDPPTFWMQDAAFTSHHHEIFQFDGIISNHVGGVHLADYLGSGYFLKNASGNDKISIAFDAPARALEFWTYKGAPYSFDVISKLYTPGGDVISENTLDFSSVGHWWLYQFRANANIGKLELFSTSGLGDNLAVDHIVAAVPEPAVLLLLGIALVGLVGLRRKIA